MSDAELHALCRAELAKMPKTSRIAHNSSSELREIGIRKVESDAPPSPPPKRGRPFHHRHSDAEAAAKETDHLTYLRCEPSSSGTRVVYRCNGGHCGGSINTVRLTDWIIKKRSSVCTVCSRKSKALARAKEAACMPVPRDIGILAGRSRR